jgi:glycosyltransferase involved in cell wall biosynthesis
MSFRPSTRSRPTVTVDVGPLLEDQWTGIPAFTRRLVQSLMRHDGIDVEFSFKLTQIPKESVLKAIRAGSGTLLRSEFERNAGHTYPLVDASSYMLSPSVKEFFQVSRYEASTVHDVSTLVMPENHVPENVDYHMRTLAREIATDDVVFCVSEATREALILAYPSAANKARVLYQYADWPENFAAIERNLPPPVPGRYAAVIGTVEPRKNLTLLIRALGLPEIRDSELRFVVIGKKGWKVDQFMIDLTPTERQHLMFSGFVTEFIKYRLLRHAEFLVFPSIYEGFGIPALEAMSLGKPVLAAMTSSLPEVIGEAGVYFDPLSTSEFAAAFAEISDERKLKELAPKAIQGASAFGWERMAQPVVEWVSGGG